MKKINDIVLLGGDERQLRLSEILKRNGHSCSLISEESEFKESRNMLSFCKVIILPLPALKDGHYVYFKDRKICSLHSIADICSPNMKVLGGGFSQSLIDIFREKNVTYYDFNEDERFALYNAFLTAQGAMRLLLENTDELLVSKKVLLTGFGRISKACANLLKAMGADVYICVRNSIARTYADCLGYKTLGINDIDKTVYIFDYIINTVPSKLFSKCNVSVMKPGALYMELASMPYGANGDDFITQNKRYILAKSLPGRFYPSPCAEAIYKAIELFL